MITESEKQIILEISKKFHAQKVLLFGSSADPHRFGRDIDIAVDGVAPDRFFQYCGELIFDLPKPVDVIPLEGDSKFQQIIRREGMVLYG
jgi:predicted nucleotidyltransferase